ncbi:WD repeat-containing protein 97 [Ochotona curzoniae]|uniref:WD repeat-containing protein 97 n=1 Tax=Ochotona curzoniae TaxID=130825 RepID=UPI001B352F04|nr:WD repeat-containing protein 97 [Ochotona curzoniae]
MEGAAPDPAGDGLLAEEEDLYDAEACDVPDPGLLSEEDELRLSGPPHATQSLAGSQRWRSLTVRARARQLWLLLRAGLHDLVEKEKRAELRVARLTHGLEPLRRLEVPAGLRSVAIDPSAGRFVVLDGEGCLHLHRRDGWAQGKLLAPGALMGLAAVLGPLGAVGRFVGWGPAGLAILRADLSLLWTSEPRVGCEITCCLPVPDLGLLLVVEEAGRLALWRFRSGGRCLVPRGSPLQLPASLEGTLKRLALWPVPPHGLPRCLVAYGSAVLTLDLQDWALVDVRRDLHKTTVSDLAYCEEVEALVTASRDTTVKVWESDWQIRMVFVGHTGPVTAMAVLPGTTHVVSASQDGTLRTWDLQAAAQVGQVSLCCWCQDALSARVSRLLAPVGPGWPMLSLSTNGLGLWSLRELHSPLAQLPAPVLHLQVAPTLPMPVHPSLPPRLVCACADGSVYLLSAATGRLVSVLLLEPEDCAAAVAYCLPREALWLLTRAGHLVRANAASCPMRVLHRLPPPPPSEPQRCCLHLYSHLPDAASAFATWELVRQHRGELHHSVAARAGKSKNRFLPVLGHTDGFLSVLDVLTSQTVFRTEAHSPGPVMAIASTWSSIVSSGGDLTVKMWRVFPYAEDSLSLLRTFSCSHPAPWLCALGKRITVGFEDPGSATYGLVQFGLGKSPRWDHRPQDDPSDHITGLCCCPPLKLYACSSLDCTVRVWTADNRLLRLLQLSGAPQALAFCSNGGDLVLALGSRLCLVNHKLYLPTSYLVKRLCQKAPDVMDDSPLPLTPEELPPAAQLHRLLALRRAASLSAALPLARHQTAEPQELELTEDLDSLAARNRDLQQLRLGLVVPEAPPQLSWRQRQEAFSQYLCAIGSAGLLVAVRLPPMPHPPTPLPVAVPLPPMPHPPTPLPVAVPLPPMPHPPTPLPVAVPLPPMPHPPTPLPVAVPLPPMPHPPTPLPDPESGRESQQWSNLEQDPGDPLKLLGARRQTVTPRAQLPQGVDTQVKRFARPPRVTLPLRPSHQGVHSKASQLLARSSLSYELGLGMDAVLSSDQLPWEMATVRGRSSLSYLQHRVPLLLKRRPRERLSKLRGFFPTTIHKGRLPPINFPGCVPNSVLLQQLWLPAEVGHLGSLVQLRSRARRRRKPHESYDEWLRRTRRSNSNWKRRWMQWLRGKTSTVDLRLQRPKAGRTKGRAGAKPRHPHAVWQEPYTHLPRFLHFFVSQNWFKKMFPTFTLQAYPESHTVEGLAQLLLCQLTESSWADRTHILHALLRLLPDLGSDVHRRLQDLVLQLLNLEEPPNFQDPTQKQFVLLALQLLLACSLESHDVVLELMSYVLYSPESCWPELKRLMDGLGLQDPQGFLLKEMLTWAQGTQLTSKAMLRKLCYQKLEGMVQQLQARATRPTARSQLCLLALPPKEAPATKTPRAPGQSVPELPSQVEAPGLPSRTLGTKHTLSDTLQSFCGASGARPHLLGPPAATPLPLPPLERTQWSRTQVLDLGCVDALNYFCEQQRANQLILLWEEAQRLRSPAPNAVGRQPRDVRRCPILRLQEVPAPSPEKMLQGECGRGWGLQSTRPAGRALDSSLRALKLPLPRVELQPFPPGWPRPARPRCPLPLRPLLQRYFVPELADPDSWR